MDSQDLNPPQSSDAVVLSASIAETGCPTTEVHRVSNQEDTSVVEVEQIKCECCGLLDECTPAYVSNVRNCHCGRWVCGLCAEAVKEELVRGLAMEDALKAHMGICMQFNRMEKKVNPVTDIASAMKRLLRRSTVGSISLRSAPSSPRHRSPITRADSCLTPFSRGRGYETPL